MMHIKVKEYFFGAVLAVSVVLTVLVFRPYLVPLALGGVMAVVTMPLYRLIRKRINSEPLAALATVVLVILVIVAPTAYFFSALAGEIGRLFNDVSNFLDYREVEAYLKRIMPPAAQQHIPTIMEQSAGLLGAIVQKLSASLVTIFNNVVAASLGFLVSMFSLYYLLKDGHRVKAELLKLSPLSDVHDRKILSNVTITVRAVIIGFLLIGLLKGVLSGLAYWGAGVPAPLFWGAMTGLANFIPMVGSGLVTIPVVIYLAVKGYWIAAFLMTLWAVFVVGLVDNFIQPRFIGGRAKIHPLLILLALLGGLQFFGFTGIILGPLVLAVTMALVSIYKSDFTPKEQLVIVSHGAPAEGQEAPDGEPASEDGN